MKTCSHGESFATLRAARQHARNLTRQDGVLRAEWRCKCCGRWAVGTFADLPQYARDELAGFSERHHQRRGAAS